MGGIAGQLLQPGEAIGFGVECGLEATDGRRAVLQHLPGPTHPLRLQLLQRHHGIDEPHLQSLLRAITAAEKPDFTCLALANHPRQVARTKAAVKTADLGSGLAKHGVVGGDAEVAEQMQHLTATHGIARHQSDHHLGQAADDALQIQHVQARQAVLTDVTTVPTHTLITTGTEGIATIGGRADPREQHHTDFTVIPDARKGITQLHHRLRAEGIALGGAVDGHASQAVRATVHKDVLVAAPRCPLRAWRTGEHLTHVTHRAQSSVHSF